MAALINTNISSLNSQRNLNASQASLATSLQRLSSGLRINSAKDDAAGLAISDRMTSQIRGMTPVAIRNANDGVSMARPLKAHCAKVGDNLQRMRELAVQSSNGTNTTADRTALNTEFAELQKEVTRVVAATKYNGVDILGAGGASLKFQVGSGTTAATDQIEVKGKDMNVAAGSETAKAADCDHHHRRRRRQQSTGSNHRNRQRADRSEHPAYRVRCCPEPL